MRIEFGHGRRRFRQDLLIAVQLGERCKSVDLSEPDVGKTVLRDGREVYVTASCGDASGQRHKLGLRSYTPEKLFFRFDEPPPRKRKFTNMEISASGRITVTDVVWIDGWSK